MVVVEVAVAAAVVAWGLWPPQTRVAVLLLQQAEGVPTEGEQDVPLLGQLRLRHDAVATSWMVAGWQRSPSFA